MGYTYKSTVSGFPEDPDELFVTRCEEGHLQIVVRSRAHTGMVCVKPEATASALPAKPDFLCARLEAARTSPESFDLDGLLGEAVTALGRWDALKAFLDSEVRDLRAEMEAETVLMRRNLQRNVKLLTQVREHMDEMEAAG